MDNTCYRLVIKKAQGTLQCNTCIYYKEFRDDHNGWCRIYPPVLFPDPDPEEVGFININPTVSGTYDWCGEHTTEADIVEDEKWFKTRLDEANKLVRSRHDH